MRCLQLFSRIAVELFCMGIVFAASTVAFASPQPETVEMKLLVDSSLLQERSAGWQQLWSAVKKVAIARDIPITEAQQPFKEGCRSIQYLDTEDQRLARQHYILRKRIKLDKNGLPKKNCDIMLKFRVPEPAASFPAIFEAGSPQPYERDIVGNIDGRAGNNQAYISQSKSIKKIPVAELMRTADYIGYFPMLQNLLSGPATGLQPVHGCTVIEYKIVPGCLHFSSAQVPVTMSYWLDADTQTPIAAEISWDCAAQPVVVLDAGQQFFTYFQHEMKDFLVPGHLKDDLIQNPVWIGKK